MTFEFTVENIPCSLSGYCFEEGYRLSNNTILLPSERDAYGIETAFLHINRKSICRKANFKPVA